MIDASGIYSITNRTNGKQYIGSAKSISKRFATHRCQLNKGKHGNRALQFAWNKYGPDAFEFSILLLCNEHDLIAQEQMAIDRLSPKYNMRKIASSNYGLRASDETRALLSTIRKGFRLPQDIIDRIAAKNRGRKHTAEAREKMRVAHRGKPSSRKGIKNSPETIEKIRQRRIGGHGPNSRPVLFNGVAYKSAKFVADKIGIKEQAFRAMLRGERENPFNARWAT